MAGNRIRPESSARAERIDPAELVKDDGVSPAAAGAADYADREYRVWQTVSGNLRALIEASGLSQREFSEHTGIAPATLSGYLKDDPEHFKIPPVAYIINLCELDEFRCFSLDVGDFLMRRLSFEPVTSGSSGGVPRRAGYIGCYYSYFFKFSTANPQPNPDINRKLRLGVILVYDDPGVDRTSGELGVIAKFFDSEGRRDEARALKEKITGMLGESSITDIRSMMRTSGSGNECYTGSLTFADKHFFLSLECRALGDHALMIFNIPEMSPSKTYIGGLGCVNSISRGGDERLPVAQRVILSRCGLDCPDAELVRQLSLAKTSQQLDPEGVELINLIRTMYDSSDDNVFKTIAEEDRIAIVSRRFANLMAQYIRRNIFSAFCITPADNGEILNFIRENLSRSDPVYAEISGGNAGGSPADAGRLRLPEEKREDDGTML